MTTSSTKPVNMGNGYIGYTTLGGAVNSIDASTIESIVNNGTKEIITVGGYRRRRKTRRSKRRSTKSRRRRA